MGGRGDAKRSPKRALTNMALGCQKQGAASPPKSDAVFAARLCTEVGT